MRKKILFVIDNLHAGGAEKTLVTLLDNIDLIKYDVTLFLISKEGEYLKEIRADIKVVHLFDLECCRIKLISNKIIRKFIFLLLSKSRINEINRRLFSKVLDEEYDVYVSFMEGISTKIVELIAPKGRKKIAWVHTDVSKYQWYRKYYKSYEEERRCYSNFNNIICVSNDALKGFEEVYFRKSTNKVIYNILDKNKIINQAEEPITLEGDFKICCVGRLEEEKGQDILIKAASKIDGDYKLYIVGEGSKKETLKTLARELNISENVVFTGFESNPYKYIKNSNVVVSSSRNEGFSLFVAESIILSKMVISTKCSGPLEILNNGEYGKLVMDEEELSLELNKIIKHKSIINKYEMLSSKRSMFFDSDTTMNKIYEIL